MFGIHDLALFIFSGFLLNLTPGPDSILVVSKSAKHGIKAGSVAVFGICIGCFVHVFAAALGLSAILASSATAFTIVKLCGAAYLMYIGAQALMTKLKTTESTEHSVTEDQFSYRSTFLQGFLSNALNPKVALFFLAFVPQFIDHDAPNKAMSFILLGSVFIFNSLIYCHLLALFTVLASQRIKAGYTFKRIMNRGIGAMFIAFGLKLALTSQQS